MVSGPLSAELSATCSALGHYDGLTYHIDPYCKETIKDLIRYLRKDEDDHGIRRYLGNSKILQTDLIPILIHHSSNDELFDVVLRLLMNLTSPALIVYQEQIPTDKTERNHYLQIVSHLQNYKQAFVKPEIWEVLAKKISKLLEVDYAERDEDISRMLERILILARNVLAVPSDPDYEKRPDNDATVHDKVLWAMHESSLAEIFLYIASSDKEQHVYMHILEIVSLMLREQKPSVLATSAIQRNFAEKEKDEEELLAFRQSEIQLKQQKVKKYAGARHGRFGGTFVMQGIKAAGDKDLIFHKPLEKAMSFDFNFEKKRIKKPKNLQPLTQINEERRSTFGVRLFLKEFCIDFLNGAYNPLMRRVKDIIEHGKSQGDESYYFWAMRFFMEFNRNHNFQVKLVSETVSIETFHFVQTQLEHWNDLMTTDKKKIPLWSRRMHLALNAYQELLSTLIEMDKSPDENVRNSSKVLKSRVFYVTEYRDLLCILMHLFKENRFSRCYLKDLIETIHIFMKLLEKYCDKHRGLIVEKKKKFQKKKKSKKSKANQNANLEVIWDQIGPQLSVVLEGNANIPTDIVPFDAASDLDIDLQKAEAMKKIQSRLKDGDIEEAVGLLRSAREVWPENDSFGSANLSPEEEFMAIHAIFMADLGKLDGSGLPGANDNDEEEDEEAEYESSQNVQVSEQDFNFRDFVNRFVSPKTIQVCGMLLSQYEKNSVHTNHCIVKLLHRISWDQGVPAMVFQASIFRVFQRVFESRNPEHKELQKFGKFIIQKFVEAAKSNPKIFMELLFWKKQQEAHEIISGYGSYSVKTHATKHAWSEEQEDELIRLFEEYQRDSPGPNMVEWLLENIINKDRTQRSVTKKLKELNLIPKEGFSKRSLREWSEEEETQLRCLVQEFLDAEKPIECIMLRLMGNRSKRNVVQKCLDLGLVSNKKELYRKKKSRRSKRANEVGDDDDMNGYHSDNRVDSEIEDSGSDEDEDSDTGTSSRPQSGTRNQSQKSKSNLKVGSTVEVINSLNKCVEDGYKEALEWLISSLLETIEDLDDDETDVPLLPISQECMKAMDESVFLNMLEIIGIKAPADEQEMYWRIPGSWKESDLRNKSSMIQDAIDGKLTVAVEKGLTETGNSTPSKESKPKKKNKLQKHEKFQDVIETIDRETNGADSQSDNSEDEGNRFNLILDEESDNSDVEQSNLDNSTMEHNLSNDMSKNRKRLVRVFSESESDNEDNITNKNKHAQNKVTDNVESNNDNKTMKNVINNFDSDTDNENDEKENILLNSNIDLTNNSTLNESKKTKRKRVLSSGSSGSESDTPINNKNFKTSKNKKTYSPDLSKRKKRAVLNSDSEDDNMDTSEISFSNKSKSVNITTDLSDDDDENKPNENLDDIDSAFETISQTSTQIHKKKSKKRAVIDSSSDEDI